MFTITPTCPQRSENSSLGTMETRHAIRHSTTIHTSPQHHNRKQANSETIATTSQRTHNTCLRRRRSQNPQLSQLCSLADCCSDAGHRFTGKCGHRTPRCHSCSWRSRLKISCSRACRAGRSNASSHLSRRFSSANTAAVINAVFISDQKTHSRLVCRSVQSDVCRALRPVSEDGQALTLEPRWLMLLPL